MELGMIGLGKMGANMADRFLERVAPFVADSGEGRWTVEEAVELKVPLPAISAALFRRYRPQDAEPLADTLLAVLRHESVGMM